MDPLVGKDSVEVVITPSNAQYRQLLGDLDTLRPTTEAKTNTAVICEAVAREAAKVRRERMKDAA